MRVTKVWMEGKRRFPKQGYNDWGEAGFGLSVELDFQDLEHLDPLLHSLWDQITANIRSQLIRLRAIESPEPVVEVKAMYLGQAETVSQMTRPAESAQPDVNRALARFMQTRQRAVDEEIFAGVDVIDVPE